MGRDDAIGRGKQRIVHRDRLGIGDVEARRKDLAAIQSLMEVSRDMNRASRAVDKDRGVFHLLERLGVEQSICGFVEVGVDRDEVGFGE